MSAADSGPLVPGLQGNLAAAARSSALVQAMGDMTTSLGTGMDATRGFLSRLDAVSLVLLAVTLAAFLIPIFILFPPVPVDRSDALRQTHSRVGLSPARSNLREQFSPEHQAREGRAPRVQGLYVYPVKSCRGIELQRSRVLPTGLEFDRLYTFAHLKPPATAADEATNKAGPVWEFLTQRQLPLLANVKVNLWVPDPSKASRQLGKVDGTFLVARFPWTDGGLRGLAQLVSAKMSRGLQAVPEKEFMLPMSFPSSEEIKARGYSFANVKIWKDITTALNMEKELPSELARYLGAKHRLGIFRMDPSRQREVFRCAQPKHVLGYQPVVDFQDAYPLHMLSLSSMQALDTQVVKDDTMKNLDVRRFRGNIIISGNEEYDEDNWKAIHLKHGTTKQECHFDVACRTVRCKMPNVDPDTGIRHKAEPDRVMRKFRDVDEGAPKMGCLGMQLCPMFPDASVPDELQAYIEVGMDIGVVQRGHHVYIGQ
ncbi:hypothetical protein FZEAL_7443 [Fusarium zealandicum]|uniref:MOSC domain-containing protein n=1 Tax=Fusarium zealandicum TaxID=1053134 RepID=A0A8H4UFR4_9HYPO|nr:hypothetical protein FZEAL_7443 [Fusarium zealandicum]